MTVTQISNRILRRIDDDPSNPGSVTPDGGGDVPPEILAAINEGMELAALLTLCFETTETFTLTAATPFFGVRASLTDYLCPLRIIGPAGRIRPATLTNLDAENTAWQNTPGDPARYVALGFNFLAITPQPATTASASFTYARTSVPVTAGAQTPELAEEYHLDLVDYGVYKVRLKEGAQSLERGVKALNRFLDRMTMLGDFVRGKSRAAGYDTLPFELKLFDRARLVGELTAAGKRT